MRENERGRETWWSSESDFNGSGGGGGGCGGGGGGGDGGSDSIGALVDARGDGRAMVTSAGGDGDGVVVCRVNGVGCHLTFLVG